MQFPNDKKGKRVAYYGLCIALAFVLSYLESLLPVFTGVPGVKLGLTNLVVLVALYRMKVYDALFINVVRIILVGLTFGNGYSFLYSLAGGIFSFVVMVILYRSKKFGSVGVSVSGGVAHNFAQIAVAMLIMETHALLFYLPVLILSGTMAGVLVGILSGQIVKRLPRDL
ncbi:MAG: Gx transporter family protein [Lachnospiraceae bacterium]|nr:Gx transporter family protein [Lachnospiraceae bacterium]